MRIVVTGGSGKGGRWVVRDLREHGHEVVNVDLVPDGAPNYEFVLTDLTDAGQVHDVVRGADAIVHFGGDPGARPPTGQRDVPDQHRLHVERLPGRRGDRRRSGRLGVERDGPRACRSTGRRDFAPIDETITPRPESSYALSKLVGETMAEQLHRQSGIPFVGFRISNIMEPPDYDRFPTWQDDAPVRKWNLWGYVDARDVATACRLALRKAPRPAPRSASSRPRTP